MGLRNVSPHQTARKEYCSLWGSALPVVAVRNLSNAGGAALRNKAGTCSRPSSLALVAGSQQDWQVSGVSSRMYPEAGCLLQRLAWRADTCETCEGATGEDLSGGYFEAGGSYLKFTYPLAFTITQLAWGVVEYRDGYAKVPQTGPFYFFLRAMVVGARAIPKLHQS